jgi:hypothetical protein
LILSLLKSQVGANVRIYDGMGDFLFVKKVSLKELTRDHTLAVLSLSPILGSHWLRQYSKQVLIILPLINWALKKYSFDKHAALSS